MFQECYLLQSSPIFQLAPREEEHIDLALESCCPSDHILEACIKIKMKIQCGKVKKRFKFKYCIKNESSLRNFSPFPSFSRFLLKKLRKLKRGCSTAEVTLKGRIKIKTDSGKVKHYFKFKLPIEDVCLEAM
ncbi:hypothetical protein [Anoxybacteroides tepidamans]|uniref:hypothetical protein n=1 Tax=Anoxybacteroides tepidamans TaxID=265948 RepID=UPI000484B3B1|nr:hypothetical protein [Anoxybacillus tepidamans]